MYKLKIFSTTKIKEPWLQLAIGEYTRRLTPILSIDWFLAKNQEAMLEGLKGHTAKEPLYIALDPNGLSFTSETFSPWLIKLFENGGSRLTVVIGGAEGLAPSIVQGAFKSVSLSPLTFTHQMARLIFLEQVYRAFEISKNSNYHK